MKKVACGICAWDLSTYKSGPDNPYAAPAGHEGLGRVLKVGKAVKGYKEGDYIVGGGFKLVTPARAFQSGDVRMAVDDQGSMVNYDIWIRHTPGAAARIPSVQGSDVWARLVLPALFLLLILAAAIGATVFVLLRRSGAAGARVG